MSTLGPLPTTRIVLARDWSEDRVADEIISHAAGVLASGSAVNVEAYLQAIHAHGAGAQEPIVAAMLAGLRDLARTGATLDEAQGMLLARYPELAPMISIAVDLDRTFRSTVVSEHLALEPPRIECPGECGPLVGTGSTRRYKLVAHAGTGSGGAVFRATDRLLSSEDKPATVAIKFVRPHPFSDLGIQREAIKARRVDDPGVVRVLDCGLDDVRSCEYAVFEWVGGGTLDEHLHANPELPVRDRVRLIQRVARGLSAINQAGLVHCDLKPANVLLGDDGVPKIADVGTSRLTLTNEDAGDIGAAGGTPAFMAPEQMGGAPASPSFDLYALGAMLAWALTGKSIAGDSIAAIDQFHAARRSGAAIAGLESIDPTLARVIDRAMAYEPDARHPSAVEFADDLDRWLSHRPIEWTRPSTLSRARLFVVRRPLFIALSVAAVTAFGGAAWQWHQNELRDARERAWDGERGRLVDGYKGMLQTFESGDLPVANGLAGIWLLHVLADASLIEDVFSADQSIQSLSVRASNEARSAPAGSLRAGLWHLVAGYWMLALDGPPDRSVFDHLENAIAVFERDVPEDDPLRMQAQALHDCAEAKAMWFARPLVPEHALPKESRAGQLARTLEVAREHLAAQEPASAVHHEVLRSLKHLYGVRMLQDIDSWNRIVRLQWELGSSNDHAQ